MADTLRLFKAQASACDLSSEDSSMTAVVAGIVSAVFLSALTVVRIAGKRAVRSWGLDDAFVSISFVLALVTIGLSIYMSYCGLGQHMWNLQDGQVLHVLEALFIATAIFPVLMALIKISIVLLYLDIFPSQGFQTSAWAVVSFICFSGLGMELFAIFTCSPVEYSWNKNIKPGYCISETYPSGMGAIVGVVQDVAVVVLPAVQVRRLQMKTRQKMLVMGLFCLGALGCLAAIARLASIIENRDIIDPTWQYASMGAWSGIELVVVYMGACLPLMRGFLGLVWPRKFGQAKQERHTAGPPADHSGGSAGPALAHEMTQLDHTALPSHERRSAWDQESSDSTDRTAQASHDYIAGSS
ncbi:hypothetical protein INS49_004061 [Diaporthe citri]|uniref:uncharacterized protein n=1 Tax=Diaporthe citri TaxID=83186 RepID=UPI001C80FBE0|nr:uncharacterized protein INS49_004061 [Diaporthe citri]KAG6354980.1 hypothetical protein INS49_004061 [Diaporthe citri]